MGHVAALLALWVQTAGADLEALPSDGARDPACRWLTETEHLGEREWIVHVVRPHERLGQVAARYGVSRDELVTWNDLSSPRARLRAGKKLKVRTDRRPPPHEKIEYTTVEGDEWSTLAVRHRVLPEELQRWNPARAGRPLAPGTSLTIWHDPGVPQTVNCRRGPAPPKLEYRRDAESLGHPQSGRLRNGIPLPDSPLWTRGRRDGLWASTHTLDTMVAAFTHLRVERGYEGDVFIGSISRKRGGKFPPHRSHRTGLDIDIRLPLLPAVPLETYPTPDNVDWPALWELIDAFLDTGEVSMIFLDRRLQRHLYWAARWAGKTPEELEPIIHWPAKDRKWEAIVRHARGHKGHIHIRLLCGPEEPRCAPSRSNVLERRGWIEPTPSGKESREGARARREAWRLEGRGIYGESGGDDDEAGDDEP